MKKKVYAYLHTHWDMEWYRDKEDFDIRLVDVVDGVIKELEEDLAPFFYFDGQVVALLNYLKIKPENKERILKLIQLKKLAIGPFFVSGDTYLVNFSSMLKNLEIGLKYSKEFGQKDFIGYICDVFGISNSIFEALELNDIDTSIIWRGVNPLKINCDCNFIKNKIKTHWLSGGYFNDFLHNENVDMAAFEKYLEKISRFSKNTLLLPIGGDHLGILKNANEKIKEINKKLNDYEIVLTSPFEYFRNIDFKNKTNEVEFLDNADTYILGGVYSSRIPQKVQNAILQNKISRIIEPLNFYLDEKYQKNIFLAYEKLIKNHAHDGICGCSIDEVKKNVDYRFEKTKNILNSIEKNIVQNFKKKYSKKQISKNTLGFFNFSNVNNIDTIELKLPYILDNAQVLDFEERFLDSDLTNIYKIPVTEEITKIYRQLVEISDNKKFSFSNVKVLKPKKRIKITNSSIENDFVKLQVIKNKIFISNKKTKEKNEIFITDIKDKGDSYNFAPCGEYKELELKESKILYDGNIQSVLRLLFSGIKLDVVLNNNSKFIKFSAEINNKTKNHKLQFNLKMKDNISKTLSNDAVGIIERNIDFNYNIQDFMPVKRPFELKTNTFPMQNFVGYENVFVLTKGLNEYEVFKNNLKICLLRCFGTISNPKNPVRAIPAGPNLKTPLAQLLGKNTVEFAIMYGNVKDAFENCDIFYDNYVAIDGYYDFEKEFFKLENDEIFYGVFKNKKIIYNLKSKKVKLI